MKKLILIPFLFCSLILSATNYYVKNGGNDSADGQSDANAWESISKVNGFTFSPGDSIFFKKGDTFTTSATYGLYLGQSGLSTDHIVISTYGTGADPIIRGTTYYCLYFNARHYIDVIGIDFDGSQNNNYSVCKCEGTSSHITLSYCTFENGWDNGIHTGNYTTTYITVSHCIVKNNGRVGGDRCPHGIYCQSSYTTIEHSEFYGNKGYGIHSYNEYTLNVDNNIVRYCYVHDNGYGEVNSGGMIMATGSDCQAYYNIIANNYNNGLRVGSGSYDFQYYNNTCYGNEGYGIQINSSGYNSIIRNNISYGNGVGSISNSGSGTILSNNYTSNPYFLNAGGSYELDTDFKLQSISGAIDAGYDVGLSEDYEANAVPHGSLPDIGAYEYIGMKYYVSNSGNNSYNGLYPTYQGGSNGPWATISKVNSVNFYPGDTIFFKRGDTWREEVSLNPPTSGTSGNYIVYAAYGTGNKPLLLGSCREDDTSDWTNYSGNIWQNNDASFSVNVGNLIFNSEASMGTYKVSLIELTSQGDFYFDSGANILYLYSASNPGTYYSSIECALDRPVIFCNGGEDYLVFQNLDVRYTAGHGFSAYNGCSYIQFLDCDFSYIGGGEFEGGAARYGNAIQFWQSSSYVTIDRCVFDQIYDAAVTPQYSGSTPANINNWHVRNNIIKNSEYSFEYFVTSSNTGTITNIYFQNNTCIDAGLGVFDGQRPDGENGRHIMIWTTPATTSNFYIRNNIFDGADESAIHIATSAEPYITFDYNCYNVTTVAYNGTTYTTLASWQTHCSCEANSISDDPEFVSSSNFHLQATSPCIGDGLDVSYSTDFDLESWDSPPSMGAYEYVVPSFSSDNDILTFVLAAQTGAATINDVTHTIISEVTYGTGLTNLVPTITVSTGATILPVSGSYQNFTNPVNYTVTAEDSSEQVWVVTVTEQDNPNIEFLKKGSNLLKSIRGKILVK